MFAAVLTTVFFSLSAIFAQRSVRAVGATRANLGRLAFAAVALGIAAHGWGGGLGGAGREWLAWSGVVGMGLGDLASFAALPRLGTRLTVLITQCVAAPLAGIAEYLWLGTTLSMAQVAWGTVILVGVGLALRPASGEPGGRVGVGWLGLLYGLGAAAGQGFGAVLSRKAREVAEQAGDVTDGFTAAYQRILGGLVITLAFLGIRAAWNRWGHPGAAPSETAARPRPRDYLWIPANALCGAVIGVSCYQWALFTTPSGLVLPIVATTPLVIVPLSFWIEGERPTRRSLTGGIVAVAGAVALTLVR